MSETNLLYHLFYRVPCILIPFLCVLSLSLEAQVIPESLDPLTGDTVFICGAGTATLKVTSQFSHEDLVFEWYERSGNRLTYLGSLEGVNGTSSYITSFLIKDQIFSVRLRLGAVVSSFTDIPVFVENEASIIQQPIIQLCGEVRLDSYTRMDSIERYQWQELIAQPSGSSEFVNMDSPSSDLSSLTATTAGFYRVVITDASGCQAISNEVEVTAERLITFDSTQGNSCFLESNRDSLGINLTASFGRTFTSYLWEESADGENFDTLSLSQDTQAKNLLVREYYDTTYYRLTISEQNCSYDTVYMVPWSQIPSGRISHQSDAIGAGSFSYCMSDDALDRTVVLETDDPNTKQAFNYLHYNNALSWKMTKFFAEISPNVHSFFSDLSQVFISIDYFYYNYTRNDEHELTFDEVDATPLDVDGGLTFATYLDTLSGCVGYSSNFQYVDVPFAFPMFRGRLVRDVINACHGDYLDFYSFDDEADAYSWLKVNPSTNELIEISDAETFGLVVEEGITDGTYYYEVTKNGCSSRSKPFEIVAHLAPTAEIVNVDTDTVTSCGVVSNVYLQGAGTNADLYRWLYRSSSDDIFSTIVGANQTYHRANRTGFYKFMTINPACSAISDSVYVVIFKEEGSNFEVGITGDSLVCENEFTLSSKYQSDSATYTWIYTDNLADFIRDPADQTAAEFVFLEDTTGSITLDARSFMQDSSVYQDLLFLLAIEEGACGGIQDTFYHVRVQPNTDLEIIDLSTGLSDSLFFCNYDSIDVTFSANILSGDSIQRVSYEWQVYNPETDTFAAVSGAAQATYHADSAGRYRAVASLPDQVCSAASNAMNIMTMPLSISGSVAYCEGNPIQLQAVQGSLPSFEGYEFQWFYSIDRVHFDSLAGHNDSQLLINPDSSGYAPGFFFFQVEYGACIDSSAIFEVYRNVDSYDLSLNIDTSDTKKGVPLIAEALFSAPGDSVLIQWEPTAFMTTSRDHRAVFTIPETYDADSVLISVTLVQGTCQVTQSRLIDFAVSDTLSDSLSDSISDSTLTSLCYFIDDSLNIYGIPRVIGGDSLFCNESLITLEAHSEDTLPDTLMLDYQWYFSKDSSTFDLIPGQSGDTLLIDVGDAIHGAGYFYYEVSYDSCTSLSPVFEVSEHPDNFQATLEFSRIQQKDKPFLVQINVDSIDGDYAISWDPGLFLVDTSENKALFMVSESYAQDTLTIQAVVNNGGCGMMLGEQVVFNTLNNDSCYVVGADLSVFTLPNVLSGARVYCGGEELSLYAEMDSIYREILASSTSFNWYYSSDSLTFSKLDDFTGPDIDINAQSPLYQPGYYYYEVAYGGCASLSGVYHVMHTDQVPSTRLLVDSVQTKGVAFQASVSIFDEGVSYFWEPESYIDLTNTTREVIYRVPDHYVFDTLTISVTQVTHGGCEYALYKQIRLKESETLLFPRFLSPNGDGINDEFEIVGLGANTSNKLKVLDAWGNLLFQLEDYYNGQEEAALLFQDLKQEGVYYYLFTQGSNKHKGSFYLKK